MPLPGWRSPFYRSAARQGARSPARRARPAPRAGLIVLLLAAGLSLRACGVARVRAEAQRPGVRLGLATVAYGGREPVPGAIELRVIVGNRTDSQTESTSIRWDPRFASAAVFAQSEPAPWRVRIDDDGWGTLDTDGVPAGQDGSFVLWFAPGEDAGLTSADSAVRVEVVANGTLEAGGGVATPAHAAERARLALQETFDRGALAAVADVVPEGASTSG
ncbi:MAG TPA: hypothetical protein VFX49_21085, partial [Chloroflexota bacterium]|nr:hypothetical protein [Chloroflexota bacterium]